MSLFKKLFGGTTSPTESNAAASEAIKQQPEQFKTLIFGRYTDCNKNLNQLRYWDDANTAFKSRFYLDAYENFFKYLGDDQLNNVTYTRLGDQLTFELIQGSQRIKGKADQHEFRAEASIVRMPTQSIPVMRKLMNLNYGLNYSKFGLNGTTLTMKFSSLAIDASPSKLYAGLSELAKKADQQDDLLLSEFASLEELDALNLPPISTDKQEEKYNFLMQWINETRQEVSRLDPTAMAGGISFLLLDLTYKIDYLICPQGMLTDELERIQLIFFEKTDATTMDRNARIMAAYDRIYQLPKEKLIEGLYTVKCTFGIAKATAHKTVMDMMFKEREKVAWYRDNGYPKIAESVYGYMVSYAFFNYGMVYPVTDILNIAMHLLNPKFYHAMGDTNNYISTDFRVNSKAIIGQLQAIVKNAQKDYPFLQFNTANLRFESPASCIDSLIVELDKIDLRKK